MIANFAANILEAFTAPRRSARNILRADLSLLDCLMMVALGVAVHGIFATVLPVFDPELAPKGVGGIGARAAEMAVQIVMFFLLSGAAYAIGLKFGGTGTLQGLRAVVAWHALASGFLAPLNVVGMRGVSVESGGPGATFPLVMISVGLSVWIFASFVAEAHGFKKIGGVIGATIMGFMLFGMLAMVLLGLMTGGGA